MSKIIIESNIEGLISLYVYLLTGEDWFVHNFSINGKDAGFCSISKIASVLFDNNLEDVEIKLSKESEKKDLPCFPKHLISEDTKKFLDDIEGSIKRAFEKNKHILIAEAL